MSNFDLFMGIPASLKLTERQRKAIDKLDLYNRRAILKTLMAEQGIDDDGNTYKVAENDIGTTKNDGYQITEVDENFNLQKIVNRLVKFNFEDASQYIRDIVKNASSLAKVNVMNKYPAINHAYNEAKRITPLAISDENKHQYISCLGAQGGKISTTFTLLGAVEKEVEDIFRKATNTLEKEKYGGLLGILKDSLKDMKNNLYGSGYGLMYSNEGDCDVLLKHKIK